MKRFQPYSAVVAALKDSQFLVVEGEEGSETVKRKEPYVSNPEGQKKRMANSVYIKGFGEETETTQCYACRTPLHPLDLRDARYVPGESCAHCYDGKRPKVCYLPKHVYQDQELG